MAGKERWGTQKGSRAGQKDVVGNSDSRGPASLSATATTGGGVSGGIRQESADPARPKQTIERPAPTGPSAGGSTRVSSSVRPDFPFLSRHKIIVALWLHDEEHAGRYCMARESMYQYLRARWRVYDEAPVCDILPTSNTLTGIGTRAYTVPTRPIRRGVWGVTAGPEAARPQKAARPAATVTVRTTKRRGCPAGPPAERFWGVTGRKNTAWSGGTRCDPGQLPKCGAAGVLVTCDPPDWSGRYSSVDEPGRTSRFGISLMKPNNSCSGRRRSKIPGPRSRARKII